MGFKVEILKWRKGNAWNKATLKQHEMKQSIRICRLWLRRAVYRKEVVSSTGLAESERRHTPLSIICRNCFLSLKTKLY